MLSLLSPIAGMAVEMAVALRFGTSATVDAFRIALSVVYLGQQFFIGSLFPNLYVPLFAEYRAQGNEAEAWRSAISLANLALIPTLIISALLFTWPDKVVWIMAPGLALPSRGWAVFFVRWFALSLVPLLYGGAALGLLYAHRVFWTAAAAQILYNIVLAASIIIFGGKYLGPEAIVIGVLVGIVAFLVLLSARLAPVLSAARIGPRQSGDLTRPSVRKGLRLGVPLLSSPLINQASGIVAYWSLSAEPVGTIAALGYSGKLTRMASLLPDVMATVLFPKFATMAHASSREQLRDLSTRAMRMAWFISLPIACSLFALRTPLVALFLRHGAFSDTATQRVAFLFALFLAGMPAGVLSVYLGKVLYALEDMWWPVYSTIASVVIAAAVMPFAGARFSAEGVALVFASLNWSAASIQAAVLHWKYAALGIRELTVFSVKIVPLSVAAAWLGGEASQFLHHLTAVGTGGLTLEVLIGGSLVFMLYWLSALLLGVPEALEFSRYLRWQTAPVVDRMRTGLRG